MQNNIQTIHDIVTSRMAQTFTMIPAIVIRYNTKTQLADVKLVVKYPYKYSSEELDTIIQDVPIIFPQGDKWQIAGKLSPNDAVLLVCSTFNLENWLSGNKEVVYETESADYHDLSSCFGIPGAFTYNSPTRDERFREIFHIVDHHNYLTMDKSDGVNMHTDKNITLTTPGCTIEVDSSGTTFLDNGGTVITISQSGQVMIEAATSVVVDTPSAHFTGNVTIAGTIGVSGQGGGGTSSITGGLAVTGGDVSADSISLKGHRHTVQGSGSSAGDSTSVAQ